MTAASYFIFDPGRIIESDQYKQTFHCIFNVMHTPCHSLFVQSLIQMISHATINNYSLLCDAAPTGFGLHRPHSGRTFTKVYL
jgi:hypothetical protein